MGEVVDLSAYRPVFRDAAALKRHAKVANERLRRIRSTAKYARQRALRLCRAVAWADKRAIAAVYAKAAELTRTTGIKHEVDHVIPLLGKRVSGLHVETNLRVITKWENLRKSNKMTDPAA